MSDKNKKIFYYGSTGILTLLMLMSAGMYIFDHGTISETFIGLGYPAYIVYPLAFAKLLGLTAIWTKKSKLLKEWAYAGFFFDFIIALFAHIMISDGGFAPAVVALILLLTSYIFDKKVFGEVYAK
ncbi:MAG: DoxX family protein [Melioribacteraceae bacterium]